MNFYRELLERAGLSSHRAKVTSLLIGLVLVVFSTVLVFSRIPGFALAVAAISLLFSSEAIRHIGQKRQEKLINAYPTIFDSVAQGISAGATLEQLFEKLALSGPIVCRNSFFLLHRRLVEGAALEKALEAFREENSNRFSDLFCELALISKEFGISGQKEAWESLAKRTRTEQGSLGMIRAKQDWVIGTSKFALVSPWLIAALLMQLPQNRLAFESETGNAVLILGLALSCFAYFLVNHLGRLSLPPRIFYEAG